MKNHKVIGPGFLSCFMHLSPFSLLQCSLFLSLKVCNPFKKLEKRNSLWFLGNYCLQKPDSRRPLLLSPSREARLEYFCSDLEGFLCDPVAQKKNKCFFFLTLLSAVLPTFLDSYLLLDISISY